MTVWTSGDWGTREQAIPGEWAALVLIMVIGAAFGFLVLWFTMLRHERTVLHRARRRSPLRPSLSADADAAGLFAGATGVAIAIGGAAVEAGDASDTGADDADPYEDKDKDEDMDMDVDMGVDMSVDDEDFDGDALEDVLGFGGEAAADAEADAKADAEFDAADLELEPEPEPILETADPEGTAEAALGPDPVLAADPKVSHLTESDLEADLVEIEVEPDLAESELAGADIAKADLAKADLDAAGALPAADGAGRRKPGKGRHRKLTDEILTRVEQEIAGSDALRYQDLAALVHREFGITVHPGSIQRALKRRRSQDVEHASRRPAEAIDPASM